MSAGPLNKSRPYVVIPKLIEQPTWGGSYIAATKNWNKRQDLMGMRLGQSYELFSGSNLSLVASSSDPLFQGELTDRDAVERPTTPPNSIALARLIEADPEAVLGREVAERTSGTLNVLIKLTQAMGNSFQIHLKDGMTHPFWKPKPESWYYLEPGLITLGVKPGVDWPAFQDALTALDEQIRILESQVHDGAITYDTAQGKVSKLIKQYNPWAYVNTVRVNKDQLVDLSGGGLQHSWEEDPENLPLGNVLYELQLEALDHNSTLRGFDKGKMSKDGSVRALNIKDYFALIDRTPEANDPATHMGAPEPVAATSSYALEKLLGTKYYNLHKLTLTARTTYRETITQYRHVFAKEGTAKVSTSAGSVELTRGHSAFVPACAGEYVIMSLVDKTEVLITTQ